MNIKNLLNISYASLALLCLIFFYISYYFNDNLWLSAVTANLATEVAGILLTVFLIDSIIEINRKREINKYRKIAFQQLQREINEHLDMFIRMLKATVTSKPSKEYKTVEEFFDENYFNSIAYLDVQKLAPISYADISRSQRVLWKVYLEIHTNQFIEALNRTIDRYGIYLDSNTVDIAEQLINSYFFRRMKFGFHDFSSPSDQEITKEYTKLFTQLINEYNQTVDNDSRKIIIDRGLWAENMLPKIGDSRLESPLEHSDLEPLVQENK